MKLKDFMKYILIVIFIIIFCSSAFPQKLIEPKLLGTWTAGEDSSEFVNHDVLDAALAHLTDNPEGKIFIRICSPDNFSEAFVKAQLSPLALNSLLKYRPEKFESSEKLSVGRYSKCLYQNRFKTSEYWFIPSKNTLENEEVFPVKNIYYKDFNVYESENLSEKQKNEKFTQNLKEFVSELKNNPHSKGFIVHNSKSAAMKRNVGRVFNTIKTEGIDAERIVITINPNLDVNEKNEFFVVKNEGNSYPKLAVLEIKNKQGE